MKLLVSTPLTILAFDSESRRADPLASDHGEYYGISWDSTGSRLVLTHSGVDSDQLVDLASYAQSERGYLSIAGEPSWPFLSAPHQVLWVDDEWIVATNTGRNALARIRVDDLSAVQRRYGGPLWDRLSPGGTEGAHYNSLFYRDGSLYVVAHNFDKGSYILHLEWPSMREIGRVSVPACGIHNFWIDPAGRWITCDTEKGALIDARSGERLWSNGGDGFLRGLAAVPGTILAGQTRIAPRNDRRHSETGIWAIDTDRWEATDYYDLGRLGGVHDIRIADRPDLCHNNAPLADGALGWLVEARSARVAHRLAGARRAADRARVWDCHLGNAGSLDDPVIRAPAGEFLLATLRQGDSAVVETTARLHLSRWWCRGDYAGLVAGFDGPGDTNLLAALFQRALDGKLTASIWLERGGWQMLAHTPIHDPIKQKELERTGDTAQLEIALRMVDGRASLAVDGLTVLSLENISAMTARPGTGGGWGIRMLGESFGLSHLQRASAP